MIGFRSAPRLHDREPSSNTCEHTVMHAIYRTIGHSLVNVFATAHVPCDFAVYMASISSEQVRVVGNHPFVCHNAVTIAAVKTTPSSIFWKPIMKYACRIEKRLGELPGAITIHTFRTACKMRSCVTWSVHVELLHSLMQLWLRIRIRELGRHNLVDSAC